MVARLHTDRNRTARSSAPKAEHSMKVPQYDARRRATCAGHRPSRRSLADSRGCLLLGAEPNADRTVWARDRNTAASWSTAFEPPWSA